MLFSDIALAASWFLGLTAIIFAVSSWYSTRRTHRHTSLEARLRDCEAELLALTDQLDKVHTIARKKYNRDAVREHRAATKSNGLPDPATDPEGWKKEMMKRHVLGAK